MTGSGGKLIVELLIKNKRTVGNGSLRLLHVTSSSLMGYLCDLLKSLNDSVVLSTILQSKPLKFF